jgi:hypothetical protein
LIAVACGALAACQNPNEIALKAGAPPPASLNLRAFETRHYATADTAQLLQAGLGTFQDLGFNATETALDVGVVAGAKQRDAHETGQMAGAVVMGLLFGAGAMQYDVSQDIHATLVAAPAGAGQVDVRVSFDRFITDNKGMLHTQLVTDPKLYQQFFDKLQTSLSIEKGHA